MKLRLVLLVVFLVAAQGMAPAATLTWTNTAGGNWNAAANWSPNSIPGAADAAVITNSGTYTVTLNVAATNASFTLGGASGTQTLAISSQTLTLNGASTVNANGVLALSGGTLTGTGDLTVSSLFNWTGGTISGAGSLFANGGLSLSGGSSKSLTGRTLVNAGAATWSGGTFFFGSGGVLSNAATGTFDCAFDGPISTGGGSGQAVANAGLFRKTAGSGTTTISPMVFNNTGTVIVQTGTLSLNGGGTDTGNFTVATGTTLNLGGGTHNLTAGNITGAGTFSISGGAANFAGTLVVTSILTVSGGVASFNGSSGTVTPAQLNISGGTLGGSNSVTVGGAMNWTSGTISGTNNVIANGGLTISGGSSKTLTGRTLVNAGSATWSDGTFFLSNGGVLSNAATGTFDCAFDGPISTGGGSGQAVANAGLFRKTAGTNATTMSSLIAFNNTGTVEVQTGTLSLNGGGTDTGNFTVATGATLNLGGGTHNLTDVNISGAGIFAVSSGTANFAGTLGGTGALNISGGTANFNVSGAITLSLLNISGGTLGGSNSVTVGGAMNWTSGTISGTNNVIANGGLTISGGSSKTLTGRTLVNAGSATWSDGTFFLSNGGVLSNAATGTFDCAFDGPISTGGGSGQAVANAGLFRKTAGTNATTMSSLIAFNNTGTVEVQTGTLSLNGGGTDTGNFTVATGATLNLGGGTHNLTDVNISGAGIFAVSSGTANFAGTLGGTGALNISGGTANFNVSGAITLSLLNISGGTLGGSNSVTVGGAMNWTSGTISGTNNVIANGGLTISGGSSKTLTGRTLVNAGSATWSDGTFFLSNGGVLSNAATGTFDCAFDGPISTGGGSGQAVANAGLFRKTAGTNATTIGSPITFHNMGTVEVRIGSLSFNGACVQTAGLTLLNGGNLSAALGFQLTGGTLAGTNTVFGSVTNNGVVSPGTSPGQLIIAGAYTQTTNGALNIELAGTSPGVTFDQLIVSNAMTLAGALNVTLTNGFYPAPDFTFSHVARAASRTGTFATFNYPSNAVGLQINYGTTNVDLEVINTLPNLPAITDQTVDELTLLSFNLGATDSDAPQQTLSYSLANSPTNASIDSSGQLTWTPTEAQGPMTTNITVLVTDNGTPSLTTNKTFQVVVREINVAPQLTLPPDIAINEQTFYTNTASATDSDIPVNSLTFALVSGPGGLNVSSAGAITWTPDESQGSNAYPVTISVTDNNPVAFNSTSLSVTSSFQIIVHEANVAPVLIVPGQQTLDELTLLAVTNTATDADFPANALSFTLASGPTGIVVNASSGVLTWTPSEFQGASTNVIQIRVTDTNPPAVDSKSLSTTNSFTVIVREINVAPVLSLPLDQTLNELTFYTNNATATDADLPANLLTFALVSGPTGLVVNANSGAITWTPSEFQGPNTNVIQISVTDTNPLAVNATSLSVTSSFTLTVREINVAPSITLPGNQTINELTFYTNNAVATDADLAANPLTFALVSGPTGMVVSATSGAITWTPSEFQGPNTNVIQVSVTDTNPLAVNATSLSVTSSFTLTVREVNVAPGLALPPNQTINELSFYTNTATATDADAPVNSLTFALVSGPTNLIVSTAGAITWTPSEAQGPGTNVIQVRVTDTNPDAVNATSLSVTNSFILTVSEVNVAPALGPLTDRTVNPGQTITFTVTATDADLPTNTLAFDLISPPSGATINSASGLFSWRPPVALANTTNTIQVRVQDNGAPVSNDVKSFTVIVNLLAPVVLTAMDHVNDQFRLGVTGSLGPDYILEGSDTLMNFIDLATNTPAAMPFTFTNASPSNNGFYRVRLSP